MGGERDLAGAGTGEAEATDIRVAGVGLGENGRNGGRVAEADVPASISYVGWPVAPWMVSMRARNILTPLQLGNSRIPVGPFLAL